MASKKIAAASDIATAAVETTAITSIKGFKADLSCRDFKFEIGKTFEIGGNIKACRNGFHACPIDQHPLSVFDYYVPAGNRFFLVTQDGAQDRDGSKLASAKITIGVELSLGDLAKRAVEWVFARANWKDGPVVTGDNEGATASGTRGAATASGYAGAATASGDAGAATASGYAGAATASGTRGAATASGYAGAATASGYAGAATASGTHGAATASGDAGAATASGKGSVAMGVGIGCKAQAAEGNPLFLLERDDSYGPNRGKPIAAWHGWAGKDGIKPDTYYVLRDGKPVEAA